MTNVTRDKCVKCIEWSLEVDSYNKSFNSETFSVQDHKCKLRLDSGLTTHNYYSFLYIEVNEELQSPIALIIRIMLNSKNLHTLGLSIKSAQQEVWSCPAMSLISQLMICEVYFPADPLKDDKSIQTPLYVDTHYLLKNLSQDYSKLLDEGLNHDVEFTCGDQSFKAHKNILCSRSEVFSSMLQSDMVEGKTGRVKIQDIDAMIFHQLLKYLYTGTLPEFTYETVMQFYKAGDKYALESLKKQCGEFLIDNLSSENACEVLILADQHHDSDFKKIVMEYMFKEKIPVVGENWPEFCKENPILTIEVLNLFCQYICSK